MKKSLAKKEFVQMLIRCESDLKVRIIRALGTTMSTTGKDYSKNDFLIHVLETGLKQINKDS